MDSEDGKHKTILFYDEPIFAIHCTTRFKWIMKLIFTILFWYTSAGGNGDFEKKRINAHKYVLISRSPVFYAMFCGNMAEKGDIVIEDMEANAFQQMLK